MTSFRHIRGKIAALLWLLASLAPSLVGGSSLGPDVGEFELKAQFVERFAGFVRWPETPEAQSFVFCVLGSTQLTDSLRAAAEGRLINDQPAQVVVLEDFENLDSCHLLFLGDLKPDALETVLDRVAQLPVLTVADRPGRAEQGVMINLFISEERIGFEINELAASRSGLELSSRLLRLARIVVADEDGL